MICLVLHVVGEGGGVTSASVLMRLCRSWLLASVRAYIVTFHKPAAKCHVQEGGGMVGGLG